MPSPGELAESKPSYDALPGTGTFSRYLMGNVGGGFRGRSIICSRGAMYSGPRQPPPPGWRQGMPPAA